MKHRWQTVSIHYVKTKNDKKYNKPAWNVNVLSLFNSIARLFQLCYLRFLFQQHDDELC